VSYEGISEPAVMRTLNRRYKGNKGTKRFNSMNS